MSEITNTDDGPFREKVDLTHPASRHVENSADREEIADTSLEEGLTAEEQAAVDSIGEPAGENADATDAVPVYATWKSGDLNTRATELGIEEPAELPNKEAVIAAIEEAEKAN